jgi:hypothetical protein
MYGIAPGTDLSFFQDRTLQQICFGAHDIQFHFDERCTLFVESSIRSQNVDGTTEEFYVIRRSEEEPAPYARAPALLNFLNDTVSTVAWKPDGTLTLVFELAGTLEIYDDSEEFESWQASDGLQFLVV